MEWRIVTEEEQRDREANRCPVFRGKRSKIQCEGDIRTHPDFHAARGEIGQWFIWKVEDGTDKDFVRNY